MTKYLAEYCEIWVMIYWLIIWYGYELYHEIFNCRGVAKSGFRTLLTMILKYLGFPVAGCPDLWFIGNSIGLVDILISHVRTKK